MSVELGTTGARKIPAMVTQIAADGTAPASVQLGRFRMV